jgi:signal transduction histidine kinase
MKLDFVAMAAHELRTPLTAVRGYLSLLMEDKQTTLGEKQKKFLDRSFYNAQILANLVENILNVSRIERGTLDLHYEVVNWPEYVQKFYEDSQGRAKDKELSLEFEAPEDASILVNIDKLSMYEVIGNLVSNSLNYTPTGGKIKIVITATDQTVTTSVIDTGEGIAPESQNMLFTKFYRAHEGLEMSAKGTGLGLFIAKSIVEMHKGQIGVTSEVGKGSTFHFTLPRAQQPPAASNATSEQSPKKVA